MNLTWAETEEELTRLKGLVFRFYEVHTPKDVRDSKALTAELRFIQLQCYAVHEQRIRLNTLWRKYATLTYRPSDSQQP